MVFYETGAASLPDYSSVGAAHVDVDTVESQLRNLVSGFGEVFGFAAPDLDDKGFFTLSEFHFFVGDIAVTVYDVVDVDEFGEEEVRSGLGCNDLTEDGAGNVVHGGEDEDGFGKKLPNVGHR